VIDGVVVVVKAGGTLVRDYLDGILDDIAGLHARGEEIVLVHGGGVLVTEYSRRLGVEPRIVLHPSGMRSRYTSWDEMRVFLMVMAGLVNKLIVSGLAKRGAPAFGLSGLDGGVLRAQRRKRIVIVNERGRKQAIPGGYTGKITSVDSARLEMLLREWGLLVFSPIALGGEGEPLNVDGDQAAASIAKALKADALVLLTDVPGVIVGGRVVERLSPGEARELASRIGPGMNRKLLMAAEAVEAGVSKVIIGDGREPDPVSRLLSEGGGTRIEE